MVIKYLVLFASCKKWLFELQDMSYATHKLKCLYAGLLKLLKIMGCKTSGFSWNLIWLYACEGRESLVELFAKHNYPLQRHKGKLVILLFFFYQYIAYLITIHVGSSDSYLFFKRSVIPMFKDSKVPWILNCLNLHNILILWSVVVYVAWLQRNT